MGRDYSGAAVEDHLLAAPLRLPRESGDPGVGKDASGFHFSPIDPYSSSLVPACAGMSGVWVSVPATDISPSHRLLPRLSSRSGLRPSSVSCLRPRTNRGGGGRSMSAVPVSLWGAHLAPAAATFGPLAFALQTTARTESSVCLRPDHLPRFQRRLTRPPLGLATPTAGRNAGGLLHERLPRHRVANPTGSSSRLRRRPERPDSRRHRTLLHQLVATGWRPLVEQGCHQYEAGSESGDNFYFRFISARIYPRGAERG